MPFFSDGTISLEEFWQMFTRGWIIDGRAGGYVRGRRHTDGGVPIIAPTYRVPFEFKFIGCMEGDEYLLPARSMREYSSEVIAINELRPSDGAPISFGADDRIIDARAEPHDRFVIVDGGQQYIVNFDATRKYYARLAEITRKFEATQGRVLSDEMIQQLATPGIS